MNGKELIVLLTMNSGNFWHVVWTTYGCWRPDDQRGDWTRLGDFYKQLTEEFPEVQLSHPLPKAWKSAGPQKDHVNLSDKARAQVEFDIRKLSAPKGDRVAGNTPVLEIAVQPHCVELIVSCDADALSQKIGRLKSRTATLLSFNPETGIGGKGTWSRGFWYAHFNDQRILDRVIALFS